MIPRAHITAWRSHAPWPDDAQVEQDLALSRAVVEIFGDPTVGAKLALRGGTAYNKLYLGNPARYSEDIDLVQVSSEPIGPVLDAIRARLDAWLGRPRHKKGEGVSNLVYRFSSEIEPVRPLRLKLEINTREHFSAFGYERRELAVESAWFRGKAAITTFSLDELLATKLRALYQRKKGRDLYDLWLALDRGDVDPKRIVAGFTQYMDAGGTPITRADFEGNLAAKANDPVFAADLRSLLSPGTSYDAAKAFAVVKDSLLTHL